MFTNKQDIAQSLGINVLSGAAANPLNYGLPNVTLVQFTGLSEQQPNFQMNQTLGVSDSSSWLHGKHNIKFGGDYKRIDLSMIGQANSTGYIYFYRTCDGAAGIFRHSGQERTAAMGSRAPDRRWPTCCWASAADDDSGAVSEGVSSREHL